MKDRCVVCGGFYAPFLHEPFQCGHCGEIMHPECDLQNLAEAQGAEFPRGSDELENYFCSQQCCDASATVRFLTCT